LAEHTKNHADGSPHGGPPNPTTPRDSYKGACVTTAGGAPPFSFDEKIFTLGTTY
jgi:hypothetical protein